MFFEENWFIFTQSSAQTATSEILSCDLTCCLKPRVRDSLV